MFISSTTDQYISLPRFQGSGWADPRTTLTKQGACLGARQGGQLLWIAPSGGRDRPNADGVWMPSPFDPSSVELMRQLLAQVCTRSPAAGFVGFGSVGGVQGCSGGCPLFGGTFVAAHACTLGIPLIC